MMMALSLPSMHIHKEIISSFKSIKKDIDNLSKEFIALGADKLIHT